MYQVRVAALNNLGKSEFSEVAHFTTDEEGNYIFLSISSFQHLNCIKQCIQEMKYYQEDRQLLEIVPTIIKGRRVENSWATREKRLYCVVKWIYFFQNHTHLLKRITRIRFSLFPFSKSSSVFFLRNTKLHLFKLNITRTVRGKREPEISKKEHENS